MDLAPLISTFGIVAVAELGDKTQLVAMTLSTSHRAASVFVGAILAVVLVDGLGILAGTALSGLIPMQLVGAIGAIVFIGFGVHALLSKEVKEVKVRRGETRCADRFHDCVDDGTRRQDTAQLYPSQIGMWHLS